MPPSLTEIIALALNEDSAFGDITSDLSLNSNHLLNFSISPRSEIVFCGQEIISQTFLQLAKSPKFSSQTYELKDLIPDGTKIKANQPIATGVCNAKLLFAAERVMLNFIQHLSGIATLTRKFVEKLDNPKIKILDTRKTLPALRKLQKQAVVHGGGFNHRFDLSEMILIKDNHIAAAGSITACIRQIKKNFSLNPIFIDKKIEIECEDISQVIEAVEFNPDFLMLDNMSPAVIREACKIIRKNSPKTKIEVSGSVNLESIVTYRNLDLDFISIGSLTHSVKACDIGLDILNQI